MATAALPLIRRAMRLIQAVSPGGTITNEEAQDALTALNAMIDSWATQRLTMVVEARELFDLVSGQDGYTVGPSGNFDTVRPVYLPRASVIQYNNPDQPLELALQIMSTQMWQQQLPTKRVFSALPSMIYYDYTYPLGHIYFWPIPNVGGLKVALYLPKALTAFADLTTEYNLAPGYEDALTYQLACRIAPEYGHQVSPDVMVLATQNLATVKRANIRLEDLTVDPALQRRGQGGLYNWISDQNA